MASKEKVQELRRMALQLRFNLIEMIGVGKAGHLGGSSSLAEIVATLYFHKMKVNRNDPLDESRDRLLLSKGHAVLIQYAAFAELGFIDRSELKKVKSLAGLLQGHPDMKIPGIEAVTGSLGMGLSIAVGMALAFKLDRKPNRVYVTMGDGELSEGQLWEAAMAASRFKLDNLVGIVDLNRIQATGPTAEIFPIPEIGRKFAAFGWSTAEIDGHDVPSIIRALDAAEAVKGMPSLIVANTVKGKSFSFAENNAAFHNGILTQELFDKATAELTAQKAALEKN
jgi:transketolase